MPLSSQLKQEHYVLNVSCYQARVPNSVFFQVCEWNQDRKGCLERIGRELQGDSLSPFELSREDERLFQRRSFPWQTPYRGSGGVDLESHRCLW